MGEVVVWRCPCQCPWDMEVWEAKPWPEDLKGLVPEDVVLVSRDGHGTPAWLGGDYDGDLNMFSFDKDFIDVVKATEGRIRQLPVEDLDQQVKDRMMELELEKAMDEEVEFELRGYSKNELEALFAGDNKLPAYLQFCLWLPTPRLRGWARVRVERVAHCALKQRSAAAWNLFFRAALTAHKAMDVPKHYKAESLVKAMDEVGKEAKIERKTPAARKPRATATMACAGPAAPQCFRGRGDMAG